MSSPVYAPESLATLVVMKFFARRERNSSKARSLPELPSSSLVCHVRRLEVSVAETLPILVTDSDGAHAITVAASAGKPLQLRGPGITITLTLDDNTASESTRAVLDPTEGWIIPLSDSLRTELSSLDLVPGDYDFGSLAIVVEK